MLAKLQQTLAYYKQLLALYQALAAIQTRKIGLFQTSVNVLGTDVSPADLAPDEYGCAETMSNIIARVVPGFPIFLSTRALCIYLKSDTRFEQIFEPETGAVLVSPTTEGNGRIPNGHTGMIGNKFIFNGKPEFEIMSNSSATGTFEKNYTTISWRARYVDIGGYPMYYFRLKQI